MNDAGEPEVTPAFVRPFSQPSSNAGTPTSTHEFGWQANPHQGQHQPFAGSSMSGSNSASDHSGAGAHVSGTPVMTTSGAAALAAAQRQPFIASTSGSSSHHATPQRSRGGSTTHLHTMGNNEADHMDASMPTIHIERSGIKGAGSGGLANASNPMSPHSNGDDDGFRMNVDGADDMADDSDDSIENKLMRRVDSSQERLELLLRLLATCQEYWADHDYVQMLREMLSWPDEWTTSMQMLERLLLELRID
ncbi:hypothetical protein LPJ53_000454 [Coemansia erecta]|uniref:Uncharacterized protein n=1 Tax=Coemansia erecta TaxID=147472 RepID=A0A9W7Y205_9FUNG|nr:hypothetical protein LPJ53_000454 [Coemansia erecta]